MNLNARKWAVRLSLAAIVTMTLVVMGCSSNKGSTEAPASSSRPESPPASPSGEAGHAMSSDMVAPAGSIPEIWKQIAAEQAELSAAIQGGQLQHVHHLAFGVRDLVVALAEKARAASPQHAAELDGLVERVKVSAGNLDELGDAGNLSGTQTEYARLQATLGEIQALTGEK